MAYRGIKRVLGESNLERKIRILFCFWLFVLIGGSFWWVNRITKDLINLNNRSQANGLKSDFMLRTHLRNVQGMNLKEEYEDTAELFKQFANEPTSIPYEAEVIVLDDTIVRQLIGRESGTWQPLVATDPDEIQRLQELIDRTNRLQREQNELEALGNIDRVGYEQKRKALEQASLLEPAEKEVENVEYSTGQSYVFYAPLIFRSKPQCIRCHFPVSKNPQQNVRLEEISQLLAKDTTTDEEEIALREEKFNMAPAMFLKITLDHQRTQDAITKNQAILVSVAIITAVLCVAMLWWIVRRFIVKPLAHLRDVTEEVSHGNMDVRAELGTGDEFEELSRSFNRMLRHLLDTQLALQNAMDDLDNKFDEQAQLNLKLYEMNQVKSEFLANMSHELRTPLNSIIGFSEILENAKGLETKQLKFASNIRNSGRLLLDLINDILDLAKLEAGKMEVKPSEFKIHQLVSELCEMVRNLADSKNIKLDYDVDKTLPPLLQDKIKVRQIITNLLSNAIKFTPEGGRIKVEAKLLDHDRIQILVRDTGVGIAESDQSIVFEKFRQGPSAIGGDALTREVSGTGLGLSIVKELCILLGGTIGLESEVGKGSTFTVTLPYNARQNPKINSEIAQTINEITKSQRVDFARAHLSPQPPKDEGDGSDDDPEPVVNPSPADG